MRDVKVSAARVEYQTAPMFVARKQAVDVASKDGTWTISGIAMGTSGPGGHYTVSNVTGDVMAFLRGMEPDDLNFFFPSTSGVHGSYCTLDQIDKLFGASEEEAREEFGFEEGEATPTQWDLTFCFVMPWMCTIYYGNVPVRSPDDSRFLRGLVEKTIKGVLARCEGNRA